MEEKWKSLYGDNSAYEIFETLQKSGRLLLWGGLILGLLVHSVWSQWSHSVNVMAVFLSHAILPLAFLPVLTLHFIPGLADTASAGARRLWHPVMMVLLSLSRRVGGARTAGALAPIPLAGVLKFVLTRRGRIVATWLGMLIQRGVLAYLAGFWIWFVFQLLTRSAAFTWGTTLGSIVSAERVDQLARWARFPWSWLYDGPSRDQIAATQSWYGQPLPVAQSGWEAWALFLMLAILVYAILPRMVFLVVEGIHLRWLIKREDFSDLRFGRILEGMLVRTGIEPDMPDPSEFRRAPGANPHMPAKSRKKRDFDAGLIVSLESIVRGRDEELSQQLKRDFQLGECRWIRLGEAAEGRDQLATRLRESLEGWLPLDHADRVLHLVDSGQNPKQSYRSRLALIREIAGPQAGVVFVLLGCHQKPLQARETLWLKSIRQWNDFNTDVVTMTVEETAGPHRED